MSPEQCRGGGHTDSKSDVSFAGRDLLRTLGGAPFVGNSRGELIVAHMMHQPAAAGRASRARHLGCLGSLVMRMLLKDKEARPTMRQVVAELDRMGGYMSGCSARSGWAGMPGVSSQLGWSASRPGPARCRAQARCRAGVPSQPGSGGVPFPSQPGQIGMNMASLPGLQAPARYQDRPHRPGRLRRWAWRRPGPSSSRWPIAVARGSLLGAVGVGVVLVMTRTAASSDHPAAAAPAEDRAARRRPCKEDGRWVVNSQPAGAMVIRQRDGQILGVTHSR